MRKIKLVDMMFGPVGFSTGYQTSKYIEWDRSPINIDDKIIFITQCNLGTINIINHDAITFGWFLESNEVMPNSYEGLKHISNKFTYVLTHNKEILSHGENFRFCPVGGCWILPEEQKIYEKSKLISIISSGKDWTSGHKFRHEIISRYKDKIDLYGNGYNTIDNKLVGLKDYAFSLVIENTKQDYYFTEKLIDCFMTGTIPIYWGCPSIDMFFNNKGIITFDNIEELNSILNNISIETYNDMKDAVIENFEKAKNFIISEDFIYKNYLQNL